MRMRRLHGSPFAYALDEWNSPSEHFIETSESFPESMTSPQAHRLRLARR